MNYGRRILADRVVKIKNLEILVQSSESLLTNPAWCIPSFPVFPFSFLSGLIPCFPSKQCPIVYFFTIKFSDWWCDETKSSFNMWPDRRNRCADSAVKSEIYIHTHTPHRCVCTLGHLIQVCFLWSWVSKLLSFCTSSIKLLFFLIPD